MANRDGSLLRDTSRAAFRTGTLVFLTTVTARGMQLFIVFVLYALVAGSTAARAFVIRVDPTQHSPGRGQVVPTLEQAVSTLRHRAAAPDGERIIEFASGLHRLDRPVRLDAALSGQSDAPLIIRGAKDGSTRLSGAVPLRRVEHASPSGVKPEIRGSVRVYQLPPSAAATPRIEVRRAHNKAAPPLGLEIFDNDGALTPARWPDRGWAYLQLRDSTPRPQLAIDAAQAARWRSERDLWICGYFGEDWSFETIPGSVHPVLSLISLGDDPLYGTRTAARYFVSHALAELDQPGEWWRDAAAGVVYLIPRAEGGSIEVSIAERLLVLEGTSHVRIENLTLERTRGDAIHVSGGTNVVVARSTIRWTGGRGIVFEGASASGIQESTITDTGEGGIVLSGGNRKMLTSSGLFADDNTILRFGRLGRTYKFAVQLDGVGVRVARNYMAQAPHSAIRFQGNDHQIALNEITGVMTETSDSGAVYTGRDVTAQGTLVRHNFLHDLQPAPGFEIKGVYLDDMASGITVEGNVFLRVQQPVFIGGGRDNTVTRNVFALSAPAVHIDGRGTSLPIAPITSSLHAALRQVPFASPVWRARYPRLARFMQDDPLVAKRNEVRGNLLIASELLRILPDADSRDQIFAENRDISRTFNAASAQRAHDFQELLRQESVTLPFDRMDRSTLLSAMTDKQHAPGRVPEKGR
jgi:hypothetical protein